MGEYDLGLEEDCDKYGYCAPPPQDFSPVEVIIHQQYNKPNKFQHDIAIIKLDRDVHVNGRLLIKGGFQHLHIIDFVSPVCLPFSEMMSSSSSSLPSDLQVAGWGAVDPLARRFSNVTQWVVVPLADKEDCVDIYKVSLAWSSVWPILGWSCRL